ncbi:MAG TPA: transglycosylase domain-containing protein [Jiangellaceae bacterium]|nr:transglycosylase domain-containing protein [Jiangellaceae bacterium]
MTDIPEANDFSRSQATIVYWNDGKTELGRFSAENRESVGIEDIPPHVQQAVIAAEDRSFYENSGFDPVGIVRAAWSSVRGGEITGGGSGITQQYVKNYYLTQERTLTRKIRELFIAVKIDQQMDKDQILQDYLNTIWFGRGTYGVQTAAKSYFGKPISELTLEEGAALAAILRNPGNYDPTLGEENLQRFTERFQYVLDGMVEKGWLAAATAAAVVPPKILPEQKNNTFGGPNGYLLQQVKKELVAAGIEPAEIETGGLRVITTFDAKAQAAAITAVTEEAPTENVENLHIGLAAVVPGDGAVVAMYGGADAVNQSFNDAIDATPQAGSTVKPFTLTAAFENDISLKSRFWGNSPLEDPKLGKPVNNEGDTDYGRYVDLLYATENSINTAFVDLTLQLGPAKVMDAMVRAGIPDDAPGLKPDGRITLGTASISSVQMADAYATVAAQGKQVDWYTVQKVTDVSGAVRHEVEPEPEQVIEPEVTAEVTYAMTQVVENGTGRAARELGRPAAGKTGQAEDLGSWFSGFTPQLAASVAYFKTDYAAETPTMLSLDGTGGLDTFAGGQYPARTWTAFMSAALDGAEIMEFPERSEIGEDLSPTPTPTPTPETCPPGTEGTPPDCKTVVQTPTKDPGVEVPSVLGRPQQQAERILQHAGFEVAVEQQETDQVPAGLVIDQSPGGGTAPLGSTVTIVVSVEPVRQDADVPNVIGMQVNQARRALQDAGFKVAVEQQSDQAPAGQVIGQDPGGGTAAPPGSTVTIVVSAPDPQP